MNILDDISRVNVIVVGDVMLDRYWWGSVTRISPEAPVPIVELEKMSTDAGGAANVAANLAGLGATPYLFGIRGDDLEGQLLQEVLSKAGVLNHSVFPLPGRKTTMKTRIVAHNQHVVRIDQETNDPISAETAGQLLAAIFQVLPLAQAVIVSDYAKGLLTNALLRGLVDRCNELGKAIIVDPKGRNFSKYAGCSVITPNKREAADACGLDPLADDTVAKSGRMLKETLGLSAALITEGENGMTLFDAAGEVSHLDSLARDVYDVTGAGDTVIAAFAAAIAAGYDHLEAAKLANAAAGIVVGHVGTTRITAAMLKGYSGSRPSGRATQNLHA